MADPQVTAAEVVPSPGAVLVPAPRQASPPPAPSPAAVLLLDTVLGAVGAGAQQVVRGSVVVVQVATPAVRRVRLPGVVSRQWQPGAPARRLAERGRAGRAAVEGAVTRAALSLVPRVADTVLDQLDLTALVKQRVDLDEVVEGVDLDAVAARIDVDAVAARIDVGAVVDRVDLVGIARSVIDEIDLPEIVRESTGALSSETVRGVRYRSVDADERIGRVVDRLLRRSGEPS